MKKEKYQKPIRSPLGFPLIQYPFAFMDYLWVIVIYVVSSFSLATFVDGHLLPQFDIYYTEKQSSHVLAVEILLQLAFQGFVAIMLFAILQKIPSPFEGLAGYNSNSSLGILLRNPAIISVILFSLSKSLQGRLTVLYSRFNSNAISSVAIYKIK
jgi:hypothetical protein